MLKGSKGFFYKDKEKNNFIDYKLKAEDIKVEILSKNLILNDEKHSLDWIKK